MAADKPSLSGAGIFILRKIYPDADQVFAFQPKSLDAIRESGLVALDTNVLLLPYNTGTDSLEQIRSTYEQLIQASRLVIPGHVAREFAKNRSEKLKELHHQIALKHNLTIKSVSYPLLEGSKPYQHLRDLEATLAEKIREYHKAVSGLLNQIRHWNWDDPVSSLYRDLFTTGVVVDPSFEDTVILSDLTERQEYQIAPGYKDAGKDDRGVGDILVWHTLLDVGRRMKRDMIFVTNDRKGDWWHQSNNEALYPRFELVEEYRRCSDGGTLHLVNFSQFLELFGAPQKIVDEVRTSESVAAIDAEARHYAADLQVLLGGQDAVWQWLVETHPSARVEKSEYRFPDILVIHPDDEVEGFEVIETSGGALSKKMSTVHRLAQKEIKDGLVDSVTCVLVVPERHVETVVVQAREYVSHEPGITVLVGCLAAYQGGQPTFVPVGRFSR